MQLWSLLNPPAGTGDIAIALPSTHRIVGGATSFFGVDQTTPLGEAAINSADTGTPANVTVSSIPGAVVLDAVAANPNTTFTTTGSGQTQQYQLSVSGGAASTQITGAGSIASGAATVTMSWHLSSPNWAIIAVPINPAPTPAGTTAPSPSPSPTPPRCVGDCNGNGTVTVDEILTIVNAALGSVPLSACKAGDANGDGQITVAEILTAVDNVLNGCAT
ncbi:MAG: dockerin type I repeat-containing protein [Candidatus Binatia bacterium]